MLRFEHIEYLYLLFSVPILFLIFWSMMSWRKKALKRLGESSLLNRLMPAYPTYKHQVKYIFAMLGLIFLILGLANLQLGAKLEKVKREGIEIMIAIDVSKSMLAEDIKPNRLEMAKRFVSRLIDKMENDRVGIIVFAGHAYLQMPLTIDYAAAKMFLNTVSTNIVPTQGTAISDAISLAMESFPQAENISTFSGKNKAIVVITDGEDHEPNTLELAQEVAKEGVIIYTVGIGSNQGSPIPVHKAGGQIDFKKDKDGNIVLSKLNEIILQQIATATDGKYLHMGNSNNDIDYLIEELSSIEKKEFEEKVYTDYEDQFQYFLIVSFVFLLIEVLISERRSKWLSDWKIFKSEA